MWHVWKENTHLLGLHNVQIICSSEQQANQLLYTTADITFKQN